MNKQVYKVKTEKACDKLTGTSCKDAVKLADKAVKKIIGDKK